MNPVELTRGRSFKGLAAYLTHDPKRKTSERVGWTQSHNLNDADAERSWRLMAATAQSADALKDAAGLKKTGAKNRTPVYHFALTWSDTDQVDDQLQQEAVGAALTALGFEQHQALAVQHTDGKPHVHVMVNLINPEDGTSAKLSYTHKKLRQWANKFEQNHGLEITEGSRANEQKRKNGEAVDARRKPRNVYEQEKAEGENPRLKWLRNQESQIAKNLQLENREMQEQHSTAWEALKESYHTQKTEMKAVREDDIQAVVRDTKARFKPEWAAVYKQNRESLKQFDAAERSPVAKAFNIGRTFFAARKDGQNMPDSFTAASMPAERRLFVEKANQRREQALAADLKGEIKTGISKVKTQHNSAMSKVRNRYLDNCKALSEGQKGERSEQQGKWRQYNERRRGNYQKITAQDRGQSEGRGFGLGQSFDRD